MTANEKILIVDDDPNILEILQVQISSFGFAHDIAADGLAAVERLKQQEYSIVITDMMMPHMDGMQLLQYIRENHPQTNVIVMTGYDRTFTYTDVIRAGASDFIAKPFNPDELEAKLNRIVREQEMVRQLEHLSISDGLTQLYNRRHFDNKLQEETQRASRQRLNAFLVLIDVDNFKAYNDQLGHPAGDEFLREVGRILTQCTRKNVDWAFRYGGDEFSLILSHIAWEQAIMTAKRIIEKFSEKNLPIAGLGIGIARFIRHQENSWEQDIANLIDRADQALYKAKSSGMNQIAVDEESR